MDRAYFVRYPRRIDDLRKPHLADREQPYKIVKTVTLSAIDFENFITDMAADRQFIEDNAALCTNGEPMKCLLVKQRGKPGGVLVIPDTPQYKAYVKLAAYITTIE